MAVVSREKEASLSHAYLLGLLHYNPLDGHFYNRITVGSRIAGRRSGGINDRKYWTVTINRRPFLGHRLAWFYMYGVWPKFNIDHINHEPLDNRIENLRDIPQSTNVGRARRAPSVSGIVGVRFHAGRWEAAIKSVAGNKYLGRFDAIEDATAAYQHAFREIHGTGFEPSKEIATLPKASHPVGYLIPKPVKPELTSAALRRFVFYDPTTGVFTRIFQGRGRYVAPGSVAGISDKEGYRHIKIDGRSYLAHRLAWFWTHGEWPAGIVDHINRNPDDNRIENLRVVNPTESATNRGMFKNNKSGFRGVWKCGSKWMAQVNRDKQVIRLGRFETAEEANAACIAARAA